jgi:hypothetical protein
MRVRINESLCLRIYIGLWLIFSPSWLSLRCDGAIYHNLIFYLFFKFYLFFEKFKKNCKTNNKKIQKNIFLMYLHRFWHFNAFTKRIRSLKIYFRHVQFLTCLFKNHWLFFFYWEDIDITFFKKYQNTEKQDT